MAVNTKKVCSILPNPNNIPEIIPVNLPTLQGCLFYLLERKERPVQVFKDRKQKDIQMQRLRLHKTVNKT